MATDFFERQALARRQSAWLIAGFVLAIVLVSAAFTLVLLAGAGWAPNLDARRLNGQAARWLGFAVTTGALVAGTMLLATAWKLWRLRAGGSAVAESLGGVAIGRNATDLKNQRLHNIIEEMALASRVPVPKVYVLTQESGINAFAAGLSAETAAIAVTAGALDRFDREELQAVIGHEFSHILNGDMVINTRMIAGLFGLYVITDCARALLDKRREKKRNWLRKRDGRIWVVVFAIYVVGSIGLFVGRLLQAAVSRRREELADASAVQFTRNPQALRSALVKIAAAADGANIKAAGAADMAHSFFAASDIGWISKLTGSWFRTHPLLLERAQALDASLTPSQFRQLVADARRATERAAVQTAAAAEAMAPAAAAMPPKEQPAVSRLRSETNASPAASDLLRNRLPRDQQGAIAALTEQAKTSADRQQAVILAVLCSHEPAQQRAQLAKLLPLLGQRVISETQALTPAVAALAPIARLPLLLAVVPLIRVAPEVTRLRLVKLARAFAVAVRPTDALRFAASRILLQSLVLRPNPVGGATPLTGNLTAISVVCSLLAMESGVRKSQAYEAGMQNLLPPQQRPALLAALPDAQAIDSALAELRTMHVSAKRSLCEALARTIAYDKRLTAGEANYLRLICLSIDSGLPTLPLNTLIDTNTLLVHAAGTG